MKTLFATAIVLLAVAPAMAKPCANASATSSTNNKTTLNNNFQPSAPAIAGPVPRGYVPVLSVYGQMDEDQQPVYGAQISIPLAR